MCGIAGVLALEGAPDPAAVKAMADALVHRGPDDEGCWTDGPVALAHRRLAIRDLSPMGHQPMLDESGQVAVTYNGEIYNDAELRRELERDHGVRFRGRCDAELLPAGWVAWGPRLFERLRGIFAVGIWDARTNELVLARDHVGTKPLFHATDRRGVWFASELKALLAAGVAAGEAPDPAAVGDLLTLGYTAPDATLLASIRQVPPGSYVVASADGALRTVTYWSPRRTGELATLDDAVAAFCDLWPTVVADQLAADVPVGVLQSGGIDSSLVLAALPGEASTTAFTARFSDATHDESATAGAVARVIGRPVTTVDVPTDPERAVAVFESVVRAVDGQLADSSTYVEHLLCEAVAEHVPVVLSGDGADELFGGYPTYRATRFAARVGRVPGAAAIGAVLGRFGGGNEGRLPRVEVAARFLTGIATDVPHAEWRRLVPPAVAADLFARPLHEVAAARSGTAGYAAAYRAVEGDPLAKALDADLLYYLPADMLRKVDAASMAHSLEVRVPFLDQRIVELAHRIDTAALLAPRGATKPVLRSALRSSGVPDEVTSGPKRGFQVPVARMLRRELQPLGAALLDRDAERLEGYVRPDAVRRLWREHQDRRRNHGYVLWSLLTLATWMRDR